MKILCICKGGNVRSVALTQAIKEDGHEAIAIGTDHISAETLLMLGKWADSKINLNHYIPIDIWRNPRDPVLKEVCRQIWRWEKSRIVQNDTEN